LLGCMVVMGGDSPVHIESSRFLNCRTVVMSVEVSFVVLSLV
jgi:hypothetical protein